MESANKFKTLVASLPHATAPGLCRGSKLDKPLYFRLVGQKNFMDGRFAGSPEVPRFFEPGARASVRGADHQASADQAPPSALGIFGGAPKDA
jgi:hypothetical protein